MISLAVREDMGESRDEAGRVDVEREERFVQLFLANERRIYS